jgi:hypothetical protein
MKLNELYNLEQSDNPNQHKFVKANNFYDLRGKMAFQYWEESEMEEHNPGIMASEFEYDFTFKFPARSIKRGKGKRNINTRIRIKKKDKQDEILYAKLNGFQKFKLLNWFRRLLIQKTEFWQWLATTLIALAALFDNIG